MAEEFPMYASAKFEIKKLCDQCLKKFQKAKFSLKIINYYSDVCDEVAKATKLQGDCPVWCELRLGRITASKLYEAAHCKTLDGIWWNAF